MKKVIHMITEEEDKEKMLNIVDSMKNNSDPDGHKKMLLRLSKQM